MRVSAVARLVSHPSIDFGSGRRSATRGRLGLGGGDTVYHAGRPSSGQATVAALRTHTSRFAFPPVGRVGSPIRRAVPPFGLPRARRA